MALGDRHAIADSGFALADKVTVPLVKHSSGDCASRQGRAGADVLWRHACVYLVVLDQLPGL